MSSNNSTKRRTKVPGRPGIYKSSSGKYEVQYRDSDGKSRFKTVEGGLMDAVAYRAELVGRVNKGEAIRPSRLTFEQFGREWLDGLEHRTKPVRERTIESYRYHFEQHLKPFHRKKLTAITTDDVARLFASMREAGYSQWTIHGTQTALSSMMARAVRRGLIPSNPVRGLERDERPATTSQKERRILTEGEIVQLLAAAEQSAYSTLANLLASTGPRISEALGIAWEDIDFAEGKWNVRAQLSRSRERVALKTKHARRSIPLDPALLRLLKLHRIASRYKAPTDFVFPAPDGRGADQRAVGRGIKRLVARAGLGEGVTSHTLRRGYGSVLISKGLDPVRVSRLMGHASADITLRIYAHEYESAQQDDRTRSALSEGFGHLLTGAS